MAIKPSLVGESIATVANVYAPDIIEAARLHDSPDGVIARKRARHDYHVYADYDQSYPNDTRTTIYPIVARAYGANETEMLTATPQMMAVFNKKAEELGGADIGIIFAWQYRGGGDVHIAVVPPAFVGREPEGVERTDRLIRLRVPKGSFGRATPSNLYRVLSIN